MNTKRTNTIALLCAAGLLFAAQACTRNYPSYLKMDGTKITGCDESALNKTFKTADASCGL